jgi:hypothetical protein
MTEDELLLLEKEWEKQEQEIRNFWSKMDKTKADN